MLKIVYRERKSTNWHIYEGFASYRRQSLRLDWNAFEFKKIY